VKRLILLLTTILLISGIPALGAETGEEAHKNQLIEDMLLYYGCHGEAAADKIDGLLGGPERGGQPPGGTLGGHHGLLEIYQYGNGDQCESTPGDPAEG